MAAFTLSQLQKKLQDFLLNPHQQDIEDITQETPYFSRKERLAIYHEAYRLRLIDALRNDYPALEKKLGHDAFIQLADEFITMNPSHHPSLRWFGEKLPSFIAEHPQFKNEISLQELALFEWIQVMAFDAADTAVITLENIRTLAPEEWMGMRLTLHPSLHVVNFYSNAPEQWNSLVKQDAALNSILSTTQQSWLIWRHELQVVYRPLTEPEHCCLNVFINQKTFADACNELLDFFTEEQVPMQAAQYLARWINDDIVCEVKSS